MSSKTINLNHNRLLTDLYFMRNQLVNNPTRSLIKYELNDFEVLNDAYGSITKTKFDIDKVVPTSSNLYNLYHNFQINEILRFYSIMYDNKDLLLNIFGCYNENLDNVKFVNFPFYNTIKKYSAKDFKNIILEFYSRYGNDIYRIVKKYFDEERIQTSYSPTMLEDFSAIYSNFTSLSSGYIFSTSDKFTSMSAKSLVHELGHAIDAETFKFPQQKKMSIAGDAFLEIPSLAFDISFSRYLVDSKIDYTGGLIIDNYSVNEIDDFGKDIEDTFSIENPIINTNGFVQDTDTNEEINIRFAIIYGVAGYFALHLDELARNDMKEFRKVFNNIITSRSESSIEELIDKFGISIDDFASGKYIKDKIKENNVALKKRFNYYE